MPYTHSFEYAVSLEDSSVFARLSGDYNPLHIDPLIARRLQFGGTVTHGIHLLLRAIDELARRDIVAPIDPAELSATFSNPVLTGAPVSVCASIEGSTVRLVAQSRDRPVFLARLQLSAENGLPIECTNDEFSFVQPHECDFPPTQAEGTVPVKLSRRTLAELFPSLGKQSSRAWMADLLATTQIVGMHCPGRHSIYSGFRLRKAAPRVTSTACMRYRVESCDARFRQLRLEVSGDRLTGTLETFFRARPVAQRSLRDIEALLSPVEFAGDRVLIVGGSRGLGECTAKIAAAGGANVTITYARGRDDAERVCEEIKAARKLCAVRPFDVSELTPPEPNDWLKTSGFSHVYFFASPFITANETRRWDERLLDEFAAVYVSAFARLVQRVLAAPTAGAPLVRFFYPSSVFVSNPEPGFAEYAVAKAAGEALCDQMQKHSRAHFSKPRLPRLQTDQTASLTAAGGEDTVPVMLELMRAFHSRAA
jgi:hypothetical protein